MTDRDRQVALASLAVVLDLKRNALIAVVIGVSVAAVAYAYRVGTLAGPALETRGSPGLFVLLAVVLAATTAFLVMTILTVRSAVAVAREAVED